MSEAFFEPWVGDKYEAAGERLLILGESHYGPPSMPGNSTKALTQEYAEGLWNHRFWTNIMQVVLGQPHWEIDRADFWGIIAFYNYVQQPVAETAGVAPTSEMFSSSKAAFFSVLERLAPKSILVLSKRLWENLPSEGRPGPIIFSREAGRGTWIYPYSGGEALASWIPHPSYGFSWRQWHPWVDALRTASSNIPLHTDAPQAARQ
jgi:hypothetical protein